MHSRPVLLHPPRQVPGQGGGAFHVQALVDSLVQDNLGLGFESSMARVAAIRDSMGRWIESLGPSTHVFDNETYSSIAPESRSVFQCSPNPFNAFVTIRLKSNDSKFEKLAVFDVLGRPVRDLLLGSRDAGLNTVVWDGKDADDRPVASGIYIVRGVVRGNICCQRVVLMR